MNTQTLYEIIALLVTGGIAKAIFDKFHLSKKDENQALIMLVEQLQKNVNANNDKVDKLEKEVEHWKLKFYEELEQKNNLKQQVNDLTKELKKFNNNEQRANG